VGAARLAIEGISAAMQRSSSRSLGADETERLFEQIARLKSEGIGGGHERENDRGNLPPRARWFNASPDALPLRAVKSISRSQWNDGFCADSGPSRGDPSKRGSRPTEASKAAVCYVRNTKPAKLKSWSYAASPMDQSQAAALHRATLQAYTDIDRLAVIQLPIPPSPAARSVLSVLAEMRSFSCCHIACN